MATEVNLPALGESVTEGTVTQWLKAVGDDVAVDEPLLEVSTDKVDTEIPSPVAGTLLEIRADEDETVEVGAVLAVIGESGESSGYGEWSVGHDGQSRGRRSADERGDPTVRAERRPAGAPVKLPSRQDEPAEDSGHSGRAWRLRARGPDPDGIGWRRYHRRHAAGARRERHRRHRHPVAEVGR